MTKPNESKIIDIRHRPKGVFYLSGYKNCTIIVRDDQAKAIADYYNWKNGYYGFSNELDSRNIKMVIK